MTKGRNIKIFVKNQSLFDVDVHRQYLWTFLVDLQAEVSRFCCRISHCFAYFLNVIVIGLIFYKLSSSDCRSFKVILK